MKKSHKRIHEIKVVVTNPKTKEEASDMIKRLSEKLNFTLSNNKLGIVNGK